MYIENPHRPQRRTFPVWACLIWTLQLFFDPLTIEHCGQAHFLTLPPTIATTGSDDAPSFFTGDTPDTPATSIGTAVAAHSSTTPAGCGVGGGGGGVSIVIPLNDLSNCGRSPVPAASTASSNISHPSAIILCPAATVLTAKR